MIICFDQRTGGGCGAENSDDAAFCRNCGRSLRFALALLDPNTVVGTYRVTRLIGYGGGGAVYKAEDLRDNRLVAVKETFDPAGVQSFRDEFVTLSRLSHALLPRYYELFEFNGNGYLAMEFVPGQSLEERIEEHGGPLPEAEVLGYARQLCEVLAFLHNHAPPILHRDIKPANVRLTNGGQIKLVDFGLLKRGTQQTRNTIRGMGTPAYAPIEQYATTGQHTDARSDIYSLGATLYRLLTDVAPPPATERVAVTPDPLLPPRAANPVLSPWVAEAVLRAMSLTQQDRFPNIESFAAALSATAAATVRLPSAVVPPTSPATSIRDLELIHTIAAHQEGIICLAVRGDGELLACGSADDTATVWRLYDGERVARLTGHERGVNGIVFTSDGAYLATGSLDKTIKFWQLDEARDVLTLEKHEDWVLALAASPDAQTLASGSADGMLWLWVMYDGAPIGSAQTGSGIWSIAWQGDGSRFATGHDDGGVQIRRSGDGRLLRRIEAHTNIVTGLAWSPEGGKLASVSNDRTGMIWEAVSGDPLYSLDGHTGNVACVAFSPDGGAVVTGSLDGMLRIFRASDGSPIAEIPAHERGVNALVWLPDGERLATAGMDGTVRVWQVLRGEPAAAPTDE